MPPTLIARPTIVEAAGNKPKIIREYAEFDEYTLVLRGTVRLSHRTGDLDVNAGQTALAPKGEWVQYSTPEPEGAEYLSVCLPAFSPETVHRDNA
jgi:ethanolamine utilization protein EutQ (cupin superfamily)